MSTTNEVWIPKNGKLHRLDLLEDTALYPTFQANDRTRPDSIQSEYSPEFEAEGTAHNHWLLGHAAASQPSQGQAYVRVPAVLTSGGVETMPLALVYIKGFKGGRYQLQLAGGNRRLIEALGEKTLADLNFERFDHAWLPPAIASGLSYAHWAANGWGYEVYDRGKPVDFDDVDPFTLYPSVSAELVRTQILADAGFTADSLLSEPMFQQLNVPSANPYVFPQKFREARSLSAAFQFLSVGARTDNHASDGIYHGSEFPPERIPFRYTATAPYRAPTEGASYDTNTFFVDTLGYYNLRATVLMRYGCTGALPGQVSAKVMLYVNGAPVIIGGQPAGVDEHRITSNSETDFGGGYMDRTFTPSLSRFLLHPNDKVEVFWQGDEWKTGPFNTSPFDPFWNIGPHGQFIVLDGQQAVNTSTTFTVELLEEFPQGGLVKLQQWLPEMKQLDFIKTYMLLGGLTIQTDDYRPHLHLAPGYQLLANIEKARNWTKKRDAYAAPNRLPERDLAFRFGSYGQRNVLQWLEDETVAAGYGDGQLLVADEVLPTEYTLATLPFAATEASNDVAGVLRIQNFKADNVLVRPIVYSSTEAKPRLTLRPATPTATVKVRQADDSLTSVLTSFSYFAGLDVGLQLNGPVLTYYWADLRAMLEQSRYLIENYRLTPQDIAELDFSIPIWDGVLGDYFAVSGVGEYDDRRPVEVRLCRIHPAHLPPPHVPGEDGLEFYGSESYTSEFY